MTRSTKRRAADQAVGIIAEGSLMAVEAESYAELKNGKVYSNLYHFVFAIQDDKIKRI